MEETHDRNETEAQNIIRNWFEKRSLDRENPDIVSLTSDARFHSICKKLEQVEGEINSYEQHHKHEWEVSSGNEKREISLSKLKRNDRTEQSKDRTLLVADITRILNEIKQHF